MQNKEYRWNAEKNEWLKKARGVSFEEVINGEFIRFERHSSKLHQRLMLFEFRNYVWVIPFINNKDHYFIKTAYPCRKYTQLYLRGDL